MSESLPKLACSKCGSSDALTPYSDGAYCFSCNSKTFTTEDKTTSPKVIKMTKPFNPVIGTVKPLIKQRGINLNTTSKWNYQIGKAFNPETGQEEDCHIAQFMKDGEIVGQKVRFNNKTFASYGDTQTLYGKWLWNSGRYIIITEGELDALSISQVMNNRYPVVSLPLGAQSASKIIKKELCWLEDNFEHVVLCFDNDEAGNRAVQECSGLFSPGKCLISRLSEKDANDCLMAGKIEELARIPFTAKPYRPDGVVTVADLLPYLDETPERGLPLPWQGLDDMLYGIEVPSLTLLTSGTGQGKTEIIKSIAANLIKEDNNIKVGMILLEESVNKTAIKMAGKMANQRFDSPQYEFAKERKEAAIQELSDLNNLFLYDNHGNKDWDKLKTVIRHMAVSEGCKVVFLDHITALTDCSENPNQLGEKIVTELNSLALSCGVAIIAISHIRKFSSSQQTAEDGGDISLDDLKGTGAIKQWFWNIISITKAGEGDEYKHFRKLTLLKCRNFGEHVGTKIYLRYSPETAELNEISEGDLL